MAEVGVLNLQVKAGGTDQATQSLRQLAGALQRVRNAVSGGIRLATVGTSIERFATRINQAVNNGTIAKINRLGEALQRLNNLGNLSNVTINIRDGNIASVRERVNQASESTRALGNEIAMLRQILSDGMLFGDLDEGEAEAIRGRIAELEGGLQQFEPTAQAAAEVAEEISAGLESVAGEVQEATNAVDTFAERARATTSLVASMGWQFGDAANNAATFTEEFMRAFEIMNRMRMSRALGEGGGGDSSSTEWTYYNPWGNVQETGWTYWKDGAIEVEGTVSAAMETISSRIEGTKVLLLGAGEAIRDQAHEASSAQSQVADASENAGTSTVNAFARVGTALREAREHLRDFAWIIRQLPDAASALRTGFERMLRPLTNIVRQFSRIAKYRAIRAVIKSITDGFKEGVENVYKYSQAIGSNFAESMDSAASSLLTMKNSIGAAVAPVIQALIPVLQAVVNWFITLVNYVNQFFALLNGQTTWTHAIAATTSAYEDQTSAAQSASAAVKDLLADWDELNIIQSENGGGGTGTGVNAGEEYLNMFEELAEFDNRVKDIVNFIKDNFETIKAIAITIGAAILAWKLANTFIHALSAFSVAEETIGHISSTLKKGIAGVATLTVGVILGWDAGHKLAAEGFTAETAIEEITSLVAGAVGGYLVAGVPGMIAGVTITIMSTVLGYIQEVNLEKNASYQELAADAFKNANGDVDPEEFKAALEEEFTKRVGTLSPAIDAFSGMPTLSDDLHQAFENVTELQNKLFGDGKVTSADVAELKKNWKEAMEALQGMENLSFKTIDLGLGEMLRAANEEAQTELINLRKTFKELAALQNGTISELEYEMDQIIARLAAGTGDEKQRNEDIENYKKYLSVIATMSKSEVSTISDLQTQAEGFDFMGEDGNMVANAKAFIDGLGTLISEANAKVDEWEKTQLENYAFQKQLLNAEIDAGLIDKEVAQPYLDAIDSAEKLVKEHAESVRSENMESVQEALDTVFKQVLTGYQGYIDEGGEAGQYYKYVKPIMEALQSAGYEIPDQFQQMLSGDTSHVSFLTLISKWLGFNTEGPLSKKDVENYLLGINPEEVAKTAKEVVEETGEKVQESVKEAANGIDWSQFSADDFSYLGISAGGGGWLSNLWDSMTKIDGDTEIPGLVYDVTIEQDPSLSDPIDAPAIDTTTFNSGLNDMWLTTKQRVSEILTLLSKLQSISFSVDTTVTTSGGFGGGSGSHGFASGGFPRSYDLVMANENGNFEMMGRMGNQPVIANNQQIVDGISKGVSSANGTMVGEMRNMVTLMQRMLNKEFVAKAVPSSSWGRNNSKSAEAYSKVTG